MRTLLLAGLLGLSSVPAAAAQSTPAAPAASPASGPASEPASDIRDMDTIVVSGVQPGPGLWKVSKGDHTLWILGTLSPLPKNMTWLARDTEAIVAQSQEVIAPPSVKFNSGLGMFRTMLLIPTALKARKNPDGKTLQEVVPADLYTRWTALKARYIGRDSGVESWRPIFAAQELYEAAMRKSGLSQKGVVWPVVEKAAKKNNVPIVETKLELTIEDPKTALKEFASNSLNDTDCFAKTLTRIEGDIEAMKARGNAWAVGDMDTLRALPQDDQYKACMDALAATSVFTRLGLSELRTRVVQVWLQRAEEALNKNPVTFATLPVGKLIEAEGYLAALKAKGYVVEAP